MSFYQANFYPDFPRYLPYRRETQRTPAYCRGSLRQSLIIYFLLWKI